jgi:hypothetical protein
VIHLGKGQGDVEWILLGREARGAEALAVLGRIHAAKMLHPTRIPIAAMVVDEGILAIGVLADPEHRGNRLLETVHGDWCLRCVIYAAPNTAGRILGLCGGGRVAKGKPQ